MMDTSANSSPNWTYMDNYHSMRGSNDADRSDPKDLCSLGVVDLNLSLSPDAFGLRAFDISKPLTRMLPGSFPCELQLMLPDSKIAPDGFHDVIVENLAASPTWRSRHISPGDVTSLRRRWPNSVFCAGWYTSTCLQGPIPPSGAPGGSTSSAIVIRGLGYCHRAAHTYAHFHSCVGGGPGAGAGAVFSGRHAFTGTDGPPSCIVRQ